ncbi:MAG: LysM peptidoglycan-binding domain-containing protein [bacterium]|nr:LysM peptidoglycan-binding domain-containing protein [bacterium]
MFRDSPNLIGKTRHVVMFVLCWALFFSSWISGGLRAAPGPEVLQIRYFSGPEKTRVVLDLSSSASYEVREINSPHRVAVNLPGFSFSNSASIVVQDNLVHAIRCNPGPSRSQVVLDLVKSSDFKVFSLPATSSLPYRVVLDVFGEQTETKSVIAQPSSQPSSVTMRPGLNELFTVVIDPGHGGLDPGAVRKGFQEKDIVLKVCLELANLIDSIPGYRAVLTRSGDYYPNLGRRVEIAREVRGDLFLSVHCNTHRKKDIKGMEIYFLSLQGATDRQASELADKENAADLIGLDPEKPSDDWVMRILMDMRMTAVLHESARLSEHILMAADASQIAQKRKAKQAGFQVLKSLAMPSALVELAYLSNESDQKNLVSVKGQKLYARVLADGLLSWRHDLRGEAVLAQKNRVIWRENYSVRKGDSLWALASRFDTTIDEIKSHNLLQSASLAVGQILRLPGEGSRP